MHSLLPLLLSLCACGRVGFAVQPDASPGPTDAPVTADAPTGDGGIDGSTDAPDGRVLVDDAAVADAAAPDATAVDAAVLDATVVPVKRVFVTSAAFTGRLDGLAGADFQCGLAAEAAGLDGMYRAWLSDRTGSPSTRFTRSVGPYVLTTGAIVADDWDDLVDGTLIRPIDRDERGDPAPSSFICQLGDVWANTASDGTAQSTVNDCEGWSVEDVVSTSNAGNTTFSDSGWTAGECISVTCSAELPLYCFEQ